MNIENFIDALAKGSGASYSLNHGAVNSGAMSSIYGHEFIPELPAGFIRYKAHLQREMIANAVREFVANKGALLNETDNYLGGWWHKGKLVLDVSKRFDSLDDAMEFGYRNKQKAVYSIDLGEEIQLTMKYPRLCDVKKTGIRWGYVFHDGEFTCEDEADALAYAQSMGYADLLSAYDDDAYYYTQWEECDDTWYEEEGGVWYECDESGKTKVN